MISTDLLLKGLAGVAVVGGASGVGVWYFTQGKTENLNLKELAGKVGLNCTGTSGQTEETGIECNIEEKGLSVKQGTNKDTAKKKGDAAGTPAGKIKGYKVGDGFKFVIEEGDITLTRGTATNISKLEQFETYEIKEDEGDKKQYLTRKNDAKKEIKLALGLPEGDTTCDLPADTTEKTCSLDANKIKKINFDGRKGEPTVVEAASGTTTINLKISKTSADDNSIFPHGYKFELQSNKEITLDSGANKSIKKDTNTEFKIKVTLAAGGPKLSLEKAWNVTELGKKVGLTCPADGKGSVKECTQGNSMNVDNGNNKKYTGLNKGDNGEGDKKVKYEENVGDHNQGFKFFVDGETDITLKNGTGGNGSDDEKKILKKNVTSGSETSYEIKKESTGNNWYLTKKTTTPAPAA